MGMELRRFLRLSLLAVLTLVGTILVLLVARHLLVPSLVWLIPTCEPYLFELGVFGSYRAQTYVSFDLASPWINTIKWDDSCDHGYHFIDLSGPGVPNRGPAILHPTGELIYTSNEFGTTLNSAIQTYRGKNYLTFWSGTKAKSSGQGAYYMYDSNYQLAHTVEAVGAGVHGDLHEFKITRDGTALITVYNTTQADLTGTGMFRNKDGWITDGIFQEIDIATGALQFEWRASDHFDARDSFMWNPFAGHSATAPFDFFHINSVEKDSRGNFLISSRHLHILVYIDGRTGDPIWVLGGQFDDLEDVSEGRASGFSWQHDARWVSEDDGIISIFDNGIAWPHTTAPFSRGRLIKVDRENGTVSLLHTYDSVHHLRSSSQGSLQLISTAEGEPHVFAGWGSSAVTTEHTLNGDILCEQHFGASMYFFWERVKSYRAFKAPASVWQAQPLDWDPVIKISGRRLYVTWNGATAVASWELQATDHEAPSTEADFRSIDAMAKTRSFESVFILPTDGHLHYRVAALDADGNFLRFSNTVSMPAKDLHTVILTVFGSLSLISVAMISLSRCRGKRSPWRGMALSLPSWDRFKYHKLR